MMQSGAPMAFGRRVPVQVKNGPTRTTPRPSAVEPASIINLPSFDRITCPPSPSRDQGRGLGASSIEYVHSPPAEEAAGFSLCRIVGQHEALSRRGHAEI